MEKAQKSKTDMSGLRSLEIEIKLVINKKLYEKGLITDEMYSHARERIIIESGKC